MTTPPAPPRLAAWLLRQCLPPDAHEIIAGDLEQEFREQLDASGPAGARRRYWRNTLASIAAVRTSRRGETPRARLAAGLALDVRSTLRAWRQSPGYVLVAVLSLAIGIGANTAIVSLARQILLQPLPVDRPDELRLVYWTPNTDDPVNVSQRQSTGYRDDSGVTYRSNFHWPLFTAMRDAAGDVASLTGAIALTQATVRIDGAQPVNATGLAVAGNFFDTIRVPMAAGRALDARDDRADAPVVAVISHAFWQRYFGGAADAIGRTLHVNDTAATVIGITDPRYRGLSPGGFADATEVTLPIAALPRLVSGWIEPGESLFAVRSTLWLRVFARVPPGRDAALTAALQPVLQRELRESGPTPAQAAASTIRLFPGARGQDSLRRAATPQLRILSAVAGIVLLIAGLNVAGLMVARGVARQRELAVRRSLGATRFRIVRGLLVESLLLSLTGAAAGLALAVWSAPTLKTMVSAGLGTVDVTVSIDRTMLAITALIAGGTGLVAGLVPAWRFSGSDGSWLVQRAPTGGSRLWIGRSLLAVQIAVSLPLVTGAGLFLRTLYNLSAIDLGFDPAHLVMFDADPTRNGRTPERTAVVFPRVLERLRQVPGVTGATLIENPLISGWESDSTVRINGQEAHLYLNSVGPDYFPTMGARLLAGRPITDTDIAGAPNVIVINQTAARRYFHSEAPLGATLIQGTRTFEVVGVMADAKYDQLKSELPPTALYSYRQRSMNRMTVMIRTAVPPAALEPAIRRAVMEADPSLPLSGFRTQTDVIHRHIGKERVFAQLLTVFGAFAMLLACLGLHGVTAYTVTRRTSEFGIRMALGAPRGRVLTMVLRQVGALALIGVAIGLPLAWMAGPAVSTFVYGLAPQDAATMAGAAALMLVVAVAAGLGPARRASRTDPLSALRME